MSAAEPPPGADGLSDDGDRHRLTTLSGLAALSLDALSSVAYGPEAIVLVLVAAGSAGLAYTLPVTLAIVVLLSVLVVSYRQVIAAFPGGGGAYAVARISRWPRTPHSAGCRYWRRCSPGTISCRTCSSCAPTGRCTATG